VYKTIYIHRCFSSGFLLHLILEVLTSVSDKLTAPSGWKSFWRGYKLIITRDNDDITNFSKASV
jgi:hypothetical protein